HKLTNTEHGLTLMDQISKVIPLLRSEENRLLQLRKAQKEQSIALSVKLVYLLDGAIMILLLVLFLLLNFNFRKRKKIEVQLARHNEELEQRVRERTELLSASEVRFRSLIENSQDLISLLDENFRMLYRSPSATRITGWTNKDLEGAEGPKNVHPDDLEATKAIFEKIKANPDKAINATYRSLHKNGHYIWLSGTGINLLNHPDVKAIVFNLQDVSAAMEAEKKLERSEKLFRTVVENTQDIISLTNREGKVIYVSPAFEKLTGHATQDLLGKSSILIMHPDNSEESKAVFEKLLQNPGISIQRSNRLLTKNGNYIDVEGTVTNFLEDENVGAIVTNYRDVTERKEAKERLEQSEKKYRQLFENNPMPMWIIAKDTFQFLDVNEAALRHYGYNREEFLSMKALDIRPEQDQQKFIEIDRSGESANKNQGIWRHKKKDGTLIYVEIVANDLITEGKAVTLILSNDLTKKIDAEEKLFKSEKLYKSIASSIPGSVVIMMDTELKYVLAEGDMLEQIGFSKDKLLGKHL
ncbi:MAG: PAS domain S-box protein, partial [Bacteroidota bacterium]